MAGLCGTGRPIILPSQEAEAGGSQGSGLPELQTVTLNPAGQLGESMFQNNSNNNAQKKEAEESSLVEACLACGEALGSSLSPWGQPYVFQMGSHLEH